MNPPVARLDVHSLDPRSLFPTTENIALVASHAQQVQIQLEQDRERVKSSGNESKLPKELRNQTLNYLSLLNDWLAQANILQSRGANQPQQQQRAPAPVPAIAHQVIMERCVIGEFPCQTSSPASPQMVKCLVDSTKQRYYAQVKKLRGTIYGSVKLYQIGRMEQGVVRFPQPCEQVAIKSFSKDLVRRRKSRDGFNVQEDPLKELAIQQRLSAVGHAFVMPLLACLETDLEFFAVLPYVGGGELFEFVASRAPLPEVEARKLFRNILDGVYYCHCAGICHRDISLENFLLGGLLFSSHLCTC